MRSLEGCKRSVQNEECTYKERRKNAPLQAEGFQKTPSYPSERYQSKSTQAAMAVRPVRITNAKRAMSIKNVRLPGRAGSVSLANR